MKLFDPPESRREENPFFHAAEKGSRTCTVHVLRILPDSTDIVLRTLPYSLSVVHFVPRPCLRRSWQGLPLALALAWHKALHWHWGYFWSSVTDTICFVLYSHQYAPQRSSTLNLIDLFAPFAAG
jgi:hypothetical protein